MKSLCHILREKRIVLPVRLHFALSALLILCLSALLSGLFISLLASFTSIAHNMFLAHLLYSVCTFIVSGLALAWVAGYYLFPAKVVADAAGRVAAGDFSVRIALPNWRIGIAEANSLIIDFNRMAGELAGMARMQKDFMGNVSHEFKTPLSSIIGFTEILLEGNIAPKERQEYLSLVYQEAQRLSRLSENTLRLSKLDAQNIILRQEVIAVDEQIRRCLILLTEKFADKELSLDIQLAPMQIKSDADLLEQIWLNLIDNALKYSPTGSMLHITGKMADSCIIVSIRDEGIGIPKDKQKHIWNRFYQCDESHKAHGHGLGLAIVKCAIDSLGGKIKCLSSVGIGTEMLVTLPTTLGKKSTAKFT